VVAVVEDKHPDISRRTTKRKTSFVVELKASILCVSQVSFLHTNMSNDQELSVAESFCEINLSKV